MTKDISRYPFLSADFFSALEESGAASPAQGWSAQHLVGADSTDDFFMPLYLRNESWGEYVFDHGWAQGYQRAGVSYFPKLVTSVPYTPVPGPRWRGQLPSVAWLWQSLREVMSEHQASGWHLLFPDEATREALAELPLVARQACHFRWNNRGYAEFDDFLGALMSRKRKNMRKERALIEQSGLTIHWRQGAEISAQWWDGFYQCYAMTYYKRGQRPYLSKSFFLQLAASQLAPQLAMVAAFENDDMVASAFYLFDGDALYGRYWGCIREYDGLHFELCYYQGIEFAIRNGLQRFDPGVQGEHKILRGFEPEITWSLHWLSDQRFHRAIGQFCEEEARGVQAYQNEARTLLPYRRG